MGWPYCREHSFSFQYIKHSWERGENSAQTDSGKWLIDTSTETDRTNNVGDYRGTDSVKTARGKSLSNRNGFIDNVRRALLVIVEC